MGHFKNYLKAKTTFSPELGYYHLTWSHSQSGFSSLQAIRCSDQKSLQAANKHNAQNDQIKPGIGEFQQ